VIDGSPHWNGNWNKQWYGVKRFFGYLESKAYKMHIRVLLSKYRSYTPCPVCGGARLKLEAMLWRLGTKADADAVVAPAKRVLPVGAKWTRAQLESLPGLTVHDLMLLPIERIRGFFDTLSLPSTLLDEALKLLLDEVRTRLKYLCDVGIGYLTLDRQSRTLSGGEVQRINLTTALGTSLVQTMFVLDEPSIGLHPRDMGRIVEAMHRLRDAGNTLVVVEHDPAVMLAADRLIDMGPGPGERGGRIVFDGTPEAIKSADTLTGAYLGARKQVAMGIKRLVGEATPRLVLQGARDHNLKNVSVEIPLHHLVCVTGVSGSGKSTLMQDVLFPALQAPLRQGDRRARRARRAARRRAARRGGVRRPEPDRQDRALEPGELRRRVRRGPQDLRRRADGGAARLRRRHVQLQRRQRPLPDVRRLGLRARRDAVPLRRVSALPRLRRQALPRRDPRRQDRPPHARRRRARALGRRRPRAHRRRGGRALRDDRDVVRLLQPIVDVGLEYVKLGQPVPTLSGGEAQRLKLAGFLAEAAQSRSASRQPVAKKGTLFLFDEPTTGLHFDDIAKLMRSFRKLLEAGHSIVVIEHNLDVIRASDWLIDLGPEGGDAGGAVVAVGPPEEVKRHATSHTAKALRDYDRALGFDGHAVEEGAPLQYLLKPARVRAAVDEQIRIVNAREHNLKSMDVAIPRGKFSVVTGVSGSGKSTLAFDILFNEGQRRYLESLNAYARSIVQPAGRPEVDAVYGIPPTVAIEQRLSRGGRKSTVATTTEVWHFLRLLWVKLGIQHCVHDDTPGRAAERREHRRAAPARPRRRARRPARAARGRAQGRLHRPREVGEGARPHAPARRRRVHEGRPVAAARPLQGAHARAAGRRPRRLGRERRRAARPAHEGARRRQGRDAPARAAHRACARRCSPARRRARSARSRSSRPSARARPCGTSYPELDPRMFSYNSKHGWCTTCVGTGLRLTREQRKAYDDSVLSDDDRGREQSVPRRGERGRGRRRRGVPRLRRHAPQPGVAQDQLRRQVDRLDRAVVGERRAQVGRVAVVDGPRRRDRARRRQRDQEPPRVPRRSGPRLPHARPRRADALGRRGAAHPPRGAARLEPAGRLLRPRRADDRAALARQRHPAQRPRQARRQGQHARRRRARRGDDPPRRPHHRHRPGRGQARRHRRRDRQRERARVASRLGDRQAARAAARPSAAAAPPDRDRAGDAHVHGASLHNLQEITVDIPLKRLVAVTGVSGSGKSTLARDVLLANLQFIGKRGAKPNWQGCEQIEGWQAVDRVLEVDQTPIGKTPRSCPATYIGFWDTIRRLFADTLEAKARGYGPARFSFNTGEGRCPGCEGQGVKTIEMSFCPTSSCRATSATASASTPRRWP
jgi:excinuclease ABC subunit A